MAATENIAKASAKHPQPGVDFQYGTAGFRMKANLLSSIAFRVGLLASLRSRKLNGQIVGVMITASHNPPEDNGVKLVDPMGEMLEASWEPHATLLANARTDDMLVELYNKLAVDLKISLNVPAKVIFARDTRSSGSTLVACLVDALNATDTEHTDFKLLTTPQLHYLVRCVNTKGTQYEYGEATEEGYYKKLSVAFAKAVKGHKPEGHVVVDCANGIGGPKLKELIKFLPAASDGGVDIKVINDNVHQPDSLNSQCGADFVKTNQRAPPASTISQLERCASLDGDADRIVYYFVDSDSKFCLLDGDRIATLAASFLGNLSRQAGLGDIIRIGVVQTAYANGASTDYITKHLNLPITCTPTGVKYLHHAASRYDIGVYFEANGHGTVLFSSSALKTISTHEPMSPAQNTALEILQATTELINQAVGDALSDLLLVELILAHKSWNLKEWMNNYVDLPNRLVRVEVADRNIFKAVDAERKLESPAGAQEAIDALVGKYKQGRAFARASGTEDAVRVYAEAATRGEADDLAQKVAGLVRQYGS